MKRKKQLLKEKKDIVRFMRFIRRKDKMMYLFFKNEIAGINLEIAENKEVKLIAERRKLQSEMEMFGRQNNKGKFDWNNDEQMKWSLCIEHNETIVIDYGCYYRQLNTVYFTSKELAEKALDKFGDRIRELYLQEGGNNE